MMYSNKKTFPALSERLVGAELKSQADFFEENQTLKKIFDAVNAMVIVVNKYRQVVFANESFLRLINRKENKFIIGQRLGEITKCIHGTDEEGGCGTSEACRYCNAGNVVLKAIDSNAASSGEIIITREANGFVVPLNLFETATPIEFNEETFYVVSLIDISDLKTKKMMERVFFHDILNTSGALMGLVMLLKMDIPDAFKTEVEFVESNFSGLVDLILGQRQLLEAENNELEIDCITLKSDEVLNSIVKLYKNHEVAKGKKLLISENSQSIFFKSDLKIIKRILENMIKNALEESSDEEIVTVGCKKVQENPTFIEFWVNNKKEIPKSVQFQIFQRSFSTKGVGRGLGTYSMKLFGEKILKGKVDFISNKDNGTTFYLRIFVG